MLDLTSFGKAVASLERGLRFAQGRLQDPAITAEETEVLKAAVIQNFEFTYELCWKFMKRWLDVNFSESHTAALSRKQLFRMAIEQRLIEGFDDWVGYHELRNLTSHTYDHEVADEIFEASPGFLQAAKQLYEQLEARND